MFICHFRDSRVSQEGSAMLLKGRWPRAIFYDSKTTLFDWSWTWKQAAARLAEIPTANDRTGISGGLGQAFRGFSSPDCVLPVHTRHHASSRSAGHALQDSWHPGFVE